MVVVMIMKLLVLTINSPSAHRNQESLLPERLLVASKANEDDIIHHTQQHMAAQPLLLTMVSHTFPAIQRQLGARGG